MKTPLIGRLAAVCALVPALALSVHAAPKKPAAKPKSKLGVKKTPQLAGGNVRFGDLYSINSGWTFQVLGARYSYDAFDDYGQSYPEPGKKFLVLSVAIKNNTNEDKYFDVNDHQFQLQDTNNATYEGGSYRLATTPGKEFSPTLKPGQGEGQSASNRLETAILIDEKAKITKIILKKGRKGAQESVMRFFVAGTAGGDPKNVVAPAAVWDGVALAKEGVFYPSSYFQFKVNKVTFSPGPIAGTEAPENRRFAVINLTVKNTTSTAESLFDFMGGALDKETFTDADGENYSASGDMGVLKASSDEQVSGELAPGQERTMRIVIAVPKEAPLKTLSLATAKGRPWVFDASAWK